MLRVIVAFGREPHEYRRFRRQGEEAVDARVQPDGAPDDVLARGHDDHRDRAPRWCSGSARTTCCRTDMTAGELLVVMGYIASMYKPLEQISTTFSSLQQAVHQPALARSTCSRRSRRSRSGRTLSALGPRARRGRVRARRLHLPRAARHAEGRHVRGRAGPVRRDRRADRRRQDDAAEPAAALLRPAAGPRPARRPRRPRPARCESLRAQISVVLQEPLLFSALDPRQHPLRPARGQRRRDRSRPRAAANAHDFISALPKGYDDRARRARRDAVGRRAPAHLGRARVPARTRRS